MIITYETKTTPYHFTGHSLTSFGAEGGGGGSLITCPKIKQSKMKNFHNIRKSKNV